MPDQSRKHRGYKTADLVAAHLVPNGWPYAVSTGAGRPGVDITGVPGLSIEVKGRRDLNLPAWLRQAESHGGGVPVVIHRPDGYGPATIDLWPVTFRMRDAITLLRDAGYGTERPDLDTRCRDDARPWHGVL